ALLHRGLGGEGGVDDLAELVPRILAGGDEGGLAVGGVEVVHLDRFLRVRGSLGGTGDTLLRRCGAGKPGARGPPAAGHSQVGQWPEAGSSSQQPEQITEGRSSRLL